MFRLLRLFMEADLVDHLFNSSEKRLARLLLLLAKSAHLFSFLEPLVQTQVVGLAGRLVGS
jgi:hypothetical protein